MIINESNKLSDFKGNSKDGRGTKVRVKKTGKVGYVDEVVKDRFSSGIKVIYEDRPGMYPDFFSVDEVEIIH